MNAPQRLHALGQSLWLDNITRDLLDTGTLAHYIDTLAVTGLTSNPTIFHQAIGGSAAYDASIRRAQRSAAPAEDVFFDLAIEDLRRAADLFEATHRRTSGVDGWVSLEVSPLIAHDTAATIESAKHLHRRAMRPNLFIKIPGTPEGLPAIEEATCAGVPVNVTLLFSPEQYLAAADAYLRGIERRIAAGLDANVASVASIFLSRWDVSVHDRVPPQWRNRLGVAVGHRAYREFIGSPRWQRALNAGARVQRLLFASTGTKDPAASDTLYVAALAAPLTIDTMPEKTLLAFADHGTVGAPLDPAGGDSDAVFDAVTRCGVDLATLAERLQREGAYAFVASWNQLIKVIEDKRVALT